jgi:DsbC/DsbD-like thiol-disulfide interchange protein
MKTRNVLWTVLALVLTSTGCSNEQKSDDFREGLTLLSSVSRPQAGSRFLVGAAIGMPIGWHTYWLNPGDAGEPARFNWKLPDGVSATPLPWPVPRVFDYDGLVSIGYENEVVIPFWMEIAEDAGNIESIALELRWMICKDICVPLKEEAVLHFHDGTFGRQEAARHAQRLKQAQAALPQADERWRFEALRDNSALTLRAFPPSDIPDSLWAKALFLPLAANVWEHRGPGSWHADKNGGYSMQTRLAPGADFNMPYIEGLLILEDHEPYRALPIKAPVKTQPVPPRNTKEDPAEK